MGVRGGYRVGGGCVSVGIRVRAWLCETKNPPTPVKVADLIDRQPPK